ncbi:MAG TPA: NAD-dependent protein deacetylase [Noviherbaspirillum sp.]|jgi:NAD-dependent SIR2 family protein deacetylase|uniref:NAD-dependent protein deacetylase n=1 Tax=Noviherbaspirillum sp. TaxID=1926288 RepID=UPI002F95D3CD
MSLKEDAGKLQQWLQGRGPVVVVTGAGLSTASGIPDYRDAHGVRRGRMPVQGPEFRADASVRKRYWARSMVGWRLLGTAQPNPGHLALAALEASGIVPGVVTQNVDGLHFAAGSRQVVELHGSIRVVRCTTCGGRLERSRMQALLEAVNPFWSAHAAAPAPDGDALLEPADLSTFTVPGCAHCGGVLQPDVVFFGDGVPPECKQRAHALLQQAGAMLVVGSSLMVHSAYRLCMLAAEQGKPLAAVNLGITRADHLFSLTLAARSEEILPALAEQLGLSGARQDNPLAHAG